MGEDDGENQPHAHQGKIFRRTEQQGKPGQGLAEGSDHDGRKGAGKKGADGRNAQRHPGPPCRAIWWPSSAVTTEVASPGMLTRIAVVEPPYWAP